MPQASREDADLAAALFGIDAGLDSLRSFAGGTGRIFSLIDGILFFGPDPAGEGTDEKEEPERRKC